ncbi:hypothetical protein BGX20_009951 [Mortierella sp. AD010]|nr:hypothetical protein BGX20_009951 [Mortierella sp. AD010]
MSDPVDAPIPTVLIVGAGLGGLMLGAALESAGSAISLTANILPVFEQLGIYEEVKSLSLPLASLDMFDTKLNNLGSIDGQDHRRISRSRVNFNANKHPSVSDEDGGDSLHRTGYDQPILTRPKLYDLLRRQVPPHKISFGKKVLRNKEHENKVTVYCSDNTVYDCSILVGADGAYSAVRQNMYKKLEGEDNLPLGDKEAFSIGYINMVGISIPLHPERYPELSETHRNHFRVVVGDKNDSCHAITVPGNQICWGIQVQLPEYEAKEQHFRNSEWGPEAIDTMLKEFEDFPCAFGGTMKEIFDTTPRNLISKVFLEEKVFQTWYHGRSVLIGDACHKLLPGGGQGAIMAMKDAVVLANCLYNMSDKSDESIKKAFASYYSQRYLEAEDMGKESATFTKIINGLIDFCAKSLLGTCRDG